MSDTVLTATFINYSSTQWNLDVWGSTTQEGVSGISQEPSATLQANAGQTTFQYRLARRAGGQRSIACRVYAGHRD